MIAVIVVVLVLALLLLVTLRGVARINRQYPPPGQFVDVDGARLHYLDLGPRNSSELPVVLIPGATSSLEIMRQPLGDMLAARHRVIIIDRPGLGWSTRQRPEDCTLAIHARMIDEALEKLKVPRALFVGHSWGGAMMPTMALNHPKRVAGLVMLAPVTHEWKPDPAFRMAGMPIVGPLMSWLMVMPMGNVLIATGLGIVFKPQRIPDGYAEATAMRLMLRPRTFTNNGRDLSALEPSVLRQVEGYARLRLPITVVAGSDDALVNTELNSRRFARDVPHARYVLLPGIGHMPQTTAPDKVVEAVEATLRDASAAPPLNG